MYEPSESLETQPARLPRRYNAATWLVDRHVIEGRSEKAAFIDDAGSLSYGDLKQRVHRIAAALSAAGVEPEQRVALCMLDTVDFPAVFLGVLKLGAVALPINTLLTAEDIRYILDDSRARTLIVSAPLWEKLQVSCAAQPMLRRVFIVGTETAPAGTELLSSAVAAAPEGDYLPRCATTRDDIAFWLYSSGSTGKPKGVLHLHQDLAPTGQLYGQSVLGIRERDLCFSAAKLSFAYGLGNSLTVPLHVGATALLMAERPTPEAIAQRFAEHAPTVFYGVPTLYASLLAAEPMTAERLRLCVSAGEALPADLYERWKATYDVDILDGIGSTELLHVFLSNRPGQVRPGSTGVPVPGYALQLRDSAGRIITEPETLGELWVSGPSASPGYWNQREKSLQTFHGPWTRTGDEYLFDADGYWHYQGRHDDMLKVSGHWVSPFEVEAALIAHEAVLEAAVVAGRDDAGLVKPRAHVVLAAGFEAGPELAQSLQDWVKSQLAPYKYPRWIDFVDTLPKTATGKIRRFMLRGGG